MCKLSKDETNFHRDRTKYQTKCKSCNSKYLREYNKARRQKDTNFKLLYNLRIRLRSALKQHAKHGSTINHLGCSIDEFKRHLESKFQSGMTWDNYGQWHLDHIKPLSSFNLQDVNEYIKAAHYSNIQPLWAEQNYIKSNKF